MAYNIQTTKNFFRERFFSETTKLDKGNSYLANIKKINERYTIVADWFQYKLAIHENSSILPNISNTTNEMLKNYAP